MSDAWGALSASERGDRAVHRFAAPAIAATVAPPASRMGDSAAESSLEAETCAAAAEALLTRRYRQCTTWCGYLVMAIGFAALIGWITGVRVLTSLSPDWITMKANTSLGLIAAGSALHANIIHHERHRWVRPMSRLCAVFVIVLAGATITEQISGHDFGIDQLVVIEPFGAVGTVHPGRMGLMTMMTFAIFGISLLTKPSRNRWQMLNSGPVLIATVLAMVVLLAYVFGAQEQFTLPGRFTAAAANTCIAFLLLGSGILFANLANGPLRSLASPYLGGMMLRRMLPTVVALIIGIVWVRLTLQSVGLFGTRELGVAVGTFSIIIAMAGILIWYAGLLDRLDKIRRRDDYEIRRLNVTLNSRVLELEAATREFRGFSYSMSHVLRAPLRAIHGYAQIVLDDLGAKLDDEGRRLLGVMQSSTDEMSELLDGILAFLRLGWQPMTIDPIDMQQQVRTAVEQLESKTAGRIIRFEIGELPGAQADASMVQRIWQNLLDNAVKFTASRNEARIEIGARSGDDQTIYFVKDNGAGFDMRYVAKLFGVFQRLHDTTQFPGTGIGLAIVNRIVARHGGRVWAEGQPDEGATFYFSLPVAEQTYA